MAVHSGNYRLGPDRGRILLRTFRQGAAARAGHDLTIEVARWSGDLTVDEQSRPSGLDVRLDMTSLTVLEGQGGLKPLTDRDRRDIEATARRELAADRYREARFQAEKFTPGAGGGAITGTLTLHGVARPLWLQVRENGDGKYHASGSVTQSEYGIKPYTGFFGALRLRDAVDMHIDVDLAQPDSAGGER
jgi:polyisoprenoid-binding protein YceI